MRSLSVQSPRARGSRLVLACALVSVAVAGCGLFKRDKAPSPAPERPENSSGAPSDQGEGDNAGAQNGNTAGSAGSSAAKNGNTASTAGASAAQSGSTASNAGAVTPSPSVPQPSAPTIGLPAMTPSTKLPMGVYDVSQGAVNALPPGATLPTTTPVIAAITSGQIRGEQLANGTVAFRGIPYARPPIGALRWKPPEPINPWTNVRDAVVAGPPCLQAPLGWNNKDAIRSREDCLYLDVRTPVMSPTARKPVMVWIHGGANWAGSGSGYLNSNIVERGVVLVTVQYRLGVFGFLSHPALTAESKQKSSGNYALLDQIAALQWVKANIAKFGGDPNNVTIFGHSAGGQDVGLLMLSPLAKGLFAKAIEQSGTAGFGLPPRTLAENEKLGEAFAAAMGVPASSKAPLEKMRAAYTTALLAAGNKLDAPALADDSFIWLQPVVDGWVLPRAPADLLAERKQAPVPLLIGSSSRELTLYGGVNNVRRTIETTFGANSARAIPLYGLDQLKTPPDDARLGDIPTQLAADINFRCPVTVVSKHQQAAGARVWQYQLDRPAPGGNGLVRHGSELPYVFESLPIFGPVASGEAAAVAATSNSSTSAGAVAAIPNASTAAGATSVATTSRVQSAGGQGSTTSPQPAAGGPGSTASPRPAAGGTGAPQPGASSAVAISSTRPSGILVNPLREPNFTSASLQAYWVRFAMTGDPNGPGLPRWPEYTRKREYLEFTESGPIARRDLRAAQCDLLNRP